MCLFPRLVPNPKYKANKKNNGTPPIVSDERVLLVPIGCGKCIECRKKKARNWQIRLYEEISKGHKGYFVTLTLSTENYVKLYKHVEDTNLSAYDIDNKIATLAIRRFLERWRKEYGKSIRHWLVTELGHEGTEHIHLHGILWVGHSADIDKKWQYGYTWIGDKPENYVNERTVNYIVKYITKIDEKHKEYNPIVLCSKGLGNNYLDKLNHQKNKYKENNTDETYRTRTGHKIALPIYYRNKIYNDEQREKLWIEKLNKNTRYVLGQKIDISENDDDYYATLKEAQQKNRRLGYGDDTINWNRKEYENKRRLLKQLERGAIDMNKYLHQLNSFKIYRNKHEIK